MLPSFTLLILFRVIDANSLFFDGTHNVWEGSQVYIYKKALFQGRQGMEEGTQ